MEENKELNPNTINLLRALIKSSTSLSHADNLIDSTVFKFGFKKLLPEWMEKFEVCTSQTMALLTNEDDQMTVTLLKYIDAFSEDFFVINQDKTELFLLYAKLKSALNDLGEMDEESKESPFASCFIAIITQMVKCIEGQFHYLTQLKDGNGVSSMRVVEIFDQVGKEIIFYEKV